MNKKTIVLSGKKINLRFGGLCWEGVVSMSNSGTSPTRAMANLIYSAMLNEDEFTKVNQGFTKDDILELVDTGYSIEKEYNELDECEKVFQGSMMYKRFMKASEENKKKRP